MPPKRSFKKTQESSLSKQTISTLNPEASEYVPSLLEKTLSNNSFKSIESNESYKSVDDFPDSDLIETENCSEITNNHIIDLDLLRMSDRNVVNSGSVLTKSNNLDFLPGLIKYGDIELPVVEYISGGTYGHVFKYSDETPLPENYIINRSPQGISYVEKLGAMTYSKPSFRRPRRKEDKVHSVAVKVFKTSYHKITIEYYNRKASLYIGDFGIGAIIMIGDKFYKILDIKEEDIIIESVDREILLIKQLEKSMDRELCNSVNAKILTLNNNMKKNEVTCVAMELMDGSLHDLKFESIKKSFAILQGIARLLQCLIDHDMSYSDLKVKNLLYKCYGSNKMKIVLGDLGSIFPLDSEVFAPCTFPPCDLVDEKTKHNTETAMVWQLGVVFIQLLKDQTYYRFGHGEIKTYTPFLKEILDNFIVKHSLETYKVKLNDDYGTNEINLGLLLKYMLNKQSRYRIRMYEIIEAELL